MCEKNKKKELKKKRKPTPPRTIIWEEGRNVESIEDIKREENEKREKIKE